MSVPLASWPPPEPVEAWEMLAEEGWPPPEPDDWDAIAQELDDAAEVNAVDLD